MQYEICTCCGKPKRPKQQSKRFTSHLLLSHSLWCVPRGIKRVRGAGWRNSDNERPFDPMFEGGWKDRQGNHYTDSEGMETVEAYECAPDCPIAELDRQSGVRKSAYPNHPESAMQQVGRPKTDNSTVYGAHKNARKIMDHCDTGGASRYFTNLTPDLVPFHYFSKSSKSDRSSNGVVNNIHPTCKPTSLVSWLCKLITPPGGVILDPFGGSGTTGVCAVRNGFHFILIEQDAHYCEIARDRIAHEYQQISGSNMVDNNVTFNYNVEKTMEVNQWQKQMHGDTTVNEIIDGIDAGEKQEAVSNTDNLSIDGCGNSQMGQSLMDTKSIISTTMQPITDLKTSNSSLGNGTITTINDSEKTTRSLMTLSIDGVESANNTNHSTNSMLGEQEPITAIASPVVLNSLGNGERQSQNTYMHIDKSDIRKLITLGDRQRETTQEGHTNHASHSRYFQQFPPDSLWCDDAEEVGA